MVRGCGRRSVLPQRGRSLLAPNGDGLVGCGVMTESIQRRDAIAAGIGRGTLAGPGWIAVSHGRYVPADADLGLLQRCRYVLPIVPADAQISHLTAARLWSAWLPKLPDWLPLHATIPPGEQRPERAGLYVARSRAALPEPGDVDGVAVVPPALVIGQLAEDLQLIDLVIAIDGLLHQGLCTVDDVLAGLRSRQRGLPMLRRALALVDARSESPWETALRLLHVLCDIPVEPQFRVRAKDGEVLARADLRITGTRRLPEYDGSAHRGTRRHANDLARDKILARHHFERYGYLSSDIRDHPGQILRDAEEALGLPHQPGRVEAWLVEFELSSLSPLGYRRLLRRLRRYVKPLRGRGGRAKSANGAEGQAPSGVSA